MTRDELLTALLAERFPASIAGEAHDDWRDVLAAQDAARLELDRIVGDGWDICKRRRDVLHAATDPRRLPLYLRARHLPSTHLRRRQAA